MSYYEQMKTLSIPALKELEDQLFRLDAARKVEDPNYVGVYRELREGHLCLIFRTTGSPHKGLFINNTKATNAEPDQRILACSMIGNMLRIWERNG